MDEKVYRDGSISDPAVVSIYMYEQEVVSGGGGGGGGDLIGAR